MKKDHSIWTKLDRFPPIIVRLLGVMHGVDNDDLITATGIPWYRLVALSWMPNWDNATVYEMQQFTKWNTVTLDNPARMRQHTRYLKNDPKFAALKKHPDYPEFIKRLRYLYEHNQ